MIHYRCFLNSDPPVIAEIWRSQRPMRGLVQSISPAVLERFVLSKPYFDRRGFIVALDDDQAIGFVHAGFGAADNLSELSTDRGVTCMLMVAAHDEREKVWNELLRRSEEYLVSGKARELYAGGTFPLNPFYLGLSGGSELPGVLATDPTTLKLYRASGYVEAGHRSVLQRKLTGFRAIVDRQQMQIRRRYHIEAMLDPPATNWWEACTIGQMNRIRFELQDRSGGQTCGTATFWDMEPLASNWGVHAMGLIDLEINSDLRRLGLATYFLGEALRQLKSHGTTLVEVQTPRDDPAVNGLFMKLGFENVDQGFVMRKDV